MVRRYVEKAWYTVDNMTHGQRLAWFLFLPGGNPTVPLYYVAKGAYTLSQKLLPERVKNGESRQRESDLKEIVEE